MQTLASIAVMAVVTVLTRALPGLLFDRGDHPPQLVLYLGRVLPPAIIAMLIVYCLRGITFASPAGWAPPLIAGLAAGWFSAAAAFRTITRVILDVYTDVSQSMVRGMVVPESFASRQPVRSN